MNKETKNKIISWMVIISFCFCLSTTSYCVGQYKAEKKCIGVLTECVDSYGVCVNLVKEYESTLEECIQKKRAVPDYMVGLCYSPNCTKEQIIMFVEDDYFLYDDFDNCSFMLVETFREEVIEQ